MYWLIIIAAVVVAALAVVRVRANRARDGVDSVRRQIDALSPEARRPVVDQVQNAASRIEPRPVDDDESGEEDDSDDGDESGGEDDSRGT
jgi:hypothetical protein